MCQLRCALPVHHDQSRTRCVSPRSTKSSGWSRPAAARQDREAHPSPPPAVSAGRRLPAIQRARGAPDTASAADRWRSVSRRTGTFDTTRPNFAPSSVLPPPTRTKVLRQRLVADLANAALEADRGNVMLAAAIRAAADLDVAVVDERHELRMTVEVLGQRRVPARATASPPGGSFRPRGSSRRRRRCWLAAAPRPAACSR